MSRTSNTPRQDSSTLPDDKGAITGSVKLTTGHITASNLTGQVSGHDSVGPHIDSAQLDSGLELPSVVGVHSQLFTSNGALGFEAGQHTLDTAAPEKVAQANFEPGQVISQRYEVLNACGEGGMGVVYRVRDQLFADRPTALKTISSSLRTQQSFAMAKAEFMTMTKLRHPNLARVYDFDRADDANRFFFTMEFINGKDAQAYTQKKTWKEIVDLIVQVCRGLAYLHSRALIHFDLKPFNVLVDEAGIAKLLDFGLCGPKATRSGEHLLATPYYMAPEMFYPNRAQDSRVDLYALGIMMYQLLCRTLPFRAKTYEEFKHHHHHTNIEFPKAIREAVPAWLLDIATRLMAKNAEDRFSSANMVIQAINDGGGLTYEMATDDASDSYVNSTSFVGRHQEFTHVLAQIKERDDLNGTAKPFVLVSGVGGIGKTRLLNELRYELQMTGWPVIDLNCYDASHTEYGVTPDIAEHVLVLARRKNLDWLIGAAAPQIIKLNPELREQLHTEPAAALQNGRDEQDSILERLSEFVVGVAQETKFVLSIDALESASDAVNSFLAKLARRISIVEGTPRQARLSVLLAHRNDGDEGAGSRELIKTLENVGLVERRPLAALGPADLQQLLGSMLGLRHLPDAFLQRIVDETGGNPYIAQEVMRSLIESGAVFLHNGTWATQGDISNLKIPRSVSELFLQRIAMLKPGYRFVLDLMSVASRPTLPDIIQRAGRLSGSQVARALRKLRQRQLVAADGTAGGAYRIAHPRMGAVIVDSLNADRRQRMHARLARSLEKFYAEQSPRELAKHAADIAMHWGHAQHRRRAVRYALVAARNARRYGRLAEAEQYLEQIARWLREQGSSRQSLFKILMRLEQLNEVLGRSDRQAEIIDELLLVSKSFADPHKEAIALMRQGGFLSVSGKAAEALTIFEQAQALYAKVKDADGERNVLREMGFTCWSLGDPGKSIHYNEQALALDRQSNNRLEQVRDSTNIALAKRAAGDQDGALALLLDALALYNATTAQQPVQDQSIYSQLTFSIGHIYSDKHDYATALDYYHKSVDCLDKNTKGFFFYKATGLNSIANTYLANDDLKSGIRYLLELAVLARRVDLGPALSGALRLGEILITLNRPVEALPHLLEATTVMERSGRQAEEAALWGKIALIYEDVLRDYEKSRAAWDSSFAISQFIGDGRGELAALDGLARSCAQQAGRQDEAVTFFELAVTRAQGLGEVLTSSRLLQMLGNLEWKRGNFDRALTHYELALQGALQAHSMHDQGLVQNAMGVVLKAMGRLDDAQHQLERSVAFNRDANQKLFEAHALATLAGVHEQLQAIEAAATCLKRALEIRRHLQDDRGQAWMSIELSRLYLRCQQPGEARHWLAAASAISQSGTDPELSEACFAIERELIQAGGVDATPQGQLN